MVVTMSFAPSQAAVGARESRVESSSPGGDDDLVAAFRSDAAATLERLLEEEFLLERIDEPFGEMLALVGSGSLPFDKYSDLVQVLRRMPPEGFNKHAIAALRACRFPRGGFSSELLYAKMILQMMDADTHGEFLRAQLEHEHWAPELDDDVHAANVKRGVRSAIYTACSASTSTPNLQVLVRAMQTEGPRQTASGLKALSRCEPTDDGGASAKGAAGSAAPLWFSRNLLAVADVRELCRHDDLGVRAGALAALNAHPPSVRATAPTLFLTCLRRCSDTPTTRWDELALDATARWLAADALVLAAGAVDNRATLSAIATDLHASLAGPHLGVRAACWHVLTALHATRPEETGVIPDAGVCRAALARGADDDANTEWRGKASAACNRVRPFCQHVTSQLASVAGTQNAAMRREAAAVLDTIDAAHLARERALFRQLADGGDGVEEDAAAADVRAKAAVCVERLERALSERPGLADELRRKAALLPYAKSEWSDAHDIDAVNVVHYVRRSYGIGGTLLHMAANRDPRGYGPAGVLGQTDMIVELVDLGAELEARNMDLLTPLHMAAASRQVDAVETLLALGSNPCALSRKPGVAYLGPSGAPPAQLTPLHLAAHFERFEVRPRALGNQGGVEGHLELAGSIGVRIQVARMLVGAALSPAAMPSDCFTGEHGDESPPIIKVSLGDEQQLGRPSLRTRVGGTPAHLAREALVAYECSALTQEGLPESSESAGARQSLENFARYLDASRRLALLRNLVRARGIVIYWLEAAAVSACRPGGPAALRDLASFYADFGSGRELMPHSLSGA